MNRVSIALKPKVYTTFRSLYNTVANTLAEFVDNAVQSYLDNAKRLNSAEKDYKLRVVINIDWENNTITISDNAAGISKTNYQRAFEPAHVPFDVTGLNEFGMGMKTASVWLADKWRVHTKALGENVERVTSFDLKKVTEEEREELVVVEKESPCENHYTRIELSDLSSNAPKPGQLSNIRSYVESIFRYYLRRGDVSIIINGKELEAPKYNILHAPYYKTPNGEDIKWKREIHFEMGPYKAHGFIAILEKMKNRANGLVLIRRGRVIVGGEGERYFPEAIFGQSGSFKYKRLFGEIELEGFKVTFNKNEFQDKEELTLFMESIRDELKRDEYNILSQADNYRAPRNQNLTKLSNRIKENWKKHGQPDQIIEQVSSVVSNLKKRNIHTGQRREISGCQSNSQLRRLTIRV